MHLARKVRNLVYHWRRGGIYRVFQKSCERVLYYFYPLLSPQRYVQIKTSIFTGYWADISHPRSFSEKVVYSKLYRPNPLARVVTDKLKVRDYVAARAGESLLTELIWQGTEPALIPFDKLPDRYVVKANHGAGLNVFVHSREQQNISEIIRQATQWMEITYSQLTRSYESQYDDVDRRVFVEHMMVDETWDTPLDYKIFCFHGEPRFIQVDIDRFGDHRRNIYDTDWNLAPFEIHYRNGQTIRTPEKLAEMLEIARKLSADFDFCRVDLYAINNQDLKFGEITLYPGGGFERFFPKRWDYRLGNLWKIDFADMETSENPLNG